MQGDFNRLDKGWFVAYYLIIPSFLLIVDNSSTQATSRVDTGAGDGDGCQVHHENSKSNGKRSKHLESKRPKAKSKNN